MTCFPIPRSGFSQDAAFYSGLVRRMLASPAAFVIVRCRVQRGGENDSSGGERPESLFTKELRRRGMAPMLTSLLEVDTEEEEGKKINGVTAAEFKKGLADQRERSMALNSEGLEGPIPRSKLLLTIAGTFFLGFWPLILIILALFAALYFYLAPSFLHESMMTARCHYHLDLM